MTGHVAVTGTSGFIGGALVAELAARNMMVTAISRRSHTVPSGVDVVCVGDYREAPFLADAALVHLAERPDIGIAEASGKAYIAEVSDRVEALLEKRYRRFIYVSSGHVYGTRSINPHSPADPVDADSVYAVAKLAAEKLVRAAGGVVVRMGNVYGPPLKPDTVMFDILNQIPGTGPLTVRDDNPARDFLWISDAAQGLANAALGTATGIFNLGTGIAVSAGEIARMALTTAGETGRPIVAETPKRAEETDAIALDSEATTAAFRWRPAVSLADGVKVLMQKRSCLPA